MKEQEYMDVTDLSLARGAKDMLQMANFMEEPNKTRYLSIMANLSLITQNLYEEIKIKESE